MLLLVCKTMYQLVGFLPGLLRSSEEAFLQVPPVMEARWVGTREWAFLGVAAWLWLPPYFACEASQKPLVGHCVIQDVSSCLIHPSY